jgi:hypothetical protein
MANDIKAMNTLQKEPVDGNPTKRVGELFIIVIYNTNFGIKFCKKQESGACKWNLAIYISKTILSQKCNFCPAISFTTRIW